MGPSLAEKTALRLGSSSGEFYESAGRPTGAEFDQQKAGLARDGPVSCLDKLRRSMGFRNILLGQVLSLLVASMSISAASLEDRGVSLPCLMNFLNYAFVFVFFSAQLVARMFKTGSVRLRSPLWKYARFAFVDVEANTLVVLAFRYTSITSVSMLDAFSIPAVMVISRLWLSAQYNREHLTGVALCLTGLALIIVSDMGDDDREEEAAYPYAVWGDLICTTGAVFYAWSNVMQEDFVKNHDRVEFLSMAGFFGALVSGVQTFAFERRLIAEVEWSLSVVLFTCAYALCLSVMYSWTSLFLQGGDAALFNLSLLTSDIYSLLFSYFVEHFTPNRLYFIAFAIIFTGLIWYHGQDPPTSANQLAGCGDGGGDGGDGVVGAEESWERDQGDVASRNKSFLEKQRDYGVRDGLAGEEGYGKLKIEMLGGPSNESSGMPRGHSNESSGTERMSELSSPSPSPTSVSPSPTPASHWGQV